MWYGKYTSVVRWRKLIEYDFELVNREDSSRVQPSPVSSSGEIKARATSPVDPTILDYFQRQPHGLSYRVYANTDQTRHFHILPTTVANERMLFQLYL